MGDVANVVSGPAQLFIAAKGTAATLTGNVADFGAFEEIGFTDKGIEFDYTATVKEIEVDELTASVDELITKESLEVTAAMAETTLTNFYRCISGGVLVSPTELTIGGQVRPTEFVLGIHAPSVEDTPVRQILIYRAMAKGTPKIHWQRKDKVMFSGKWHALADSTKADGANLCEVKDF